MNHPLSKIKHLDEQGQPQVYFIKCKGCGTVETGIVGIAQMAKKRREHINMHKGNNEYVKGSMSHGYMKDFIA
jgi:hypothetical protein